MNKGTSGTATRQREPFSKRIIVCCDGTWQDGTIKKQHTNILKISRIIGHQDDRNVPPVPQVVFYQSGVGTDRGWFMNGYEGTLGTTLKEKVQEAYAFIANNYQPDDEIFLFGFSRGAYTARMVAGFIGAIGILDKRDMDHFADIFTTFQTRAHTKDKTKISEMDEYLRRFTSPTSEGRLRAHIDDDQRFSIKCLGVFETVGTIGLPEEVRLCHKVETIFGFPDKILGEHIQHGFQAIGINETRVDFPITKIEQTDKGRRLGQTLKQVWFSGCHSDIGGGYEAHDLSDIALTWMLANVEKMLSLDLEYFKSLLRPVKDWGEQPPHDPSTGIFKLALTTPRYLPSTKSPEIPTYEWIHPSVLRQCKLIPEIPQLLESDPGIVCSLQPLEEGIQLLWNQLPRRDAQLLDLTHAEQTKWSSVWPVLKRSSPIAVVVLSIAVWFAIGNYDSRKLPLN